MLIAAALLARLLLSVVFAVAGIAKLADRRGSVEALAGFGAPGWSQRPLAVVLPALELGIACGLLIDGAAPWAALLALALLVGFAMVIATTLAHGRRPACHCFGELSHKPAGLWTLVRTSLLAGLAVGLVAALLAQPAPSLWGWLGRLAPIEVAMLLLCVALAVALGFAAWFASELLRQNGRLLLRLEAVESSLGLRPAAGAEPAVVRALPVGAPAPAFRVAGAADGEVSLAGLLARGRPVALLFTDAHCEPCRTLLADIPELQRRYAKALTIAVAMSGSFQDVRSLHREHAIADLLLARDGELARSYGAEATPSAVVIAADGRIATPVARGGRAVRALIEQRAGETSRGAAERSAAPFRAHTPLAVEVGHHGA
jgi:uncharacterized membrane protein YphA (DoxX/SURF4 family)/peroxiredoxin